MPVASNGVGYSEETPEKVKIVDAYLSRLFRIVGNIAARPKSSRHFPYHFIDLFCGAGVNPDSDGTPSLAVMILCKLQSVDWDWRADLIDAGENEHGRPHVDLMRDALYRCGVDVRRVRFHHRKYQDALPGIAGSVRGHGLVLVDPNTPTECYEAAILLKDHPKELYMTDHLYHFAAMGWKRYRAYAQNNGISYERYFTDLLDATGKVRALLRRSSVAIQQQWTFIHSTNAGADVVNQFVKQGWHDANTPIGQRMIEDLTYTKSEQGRIYRAQPILWEQ